MSDSSTVPPSLCHLCWKPEHGGTACAVTTLLDQLIEAAKAYGHHSTLRESSDDTVAYWFDRMNRLWHDIRFHIDIDGAVTVTLDDAGNCVAVTRTDEENKSLDVIWRAPASPPPMDPRVHADGTDCGDHNCSRGHYDIPNPDWHPASPAAGQKELRGPPINGKLFCPQTGEWIEVTNLAEWYDHPTAPAPAAAAKRMKK